MPLRARHEVFVAVGQGRNKSEAERACCTAACEKLHQEGLLIKPISQNPSSAVPELKPGPTKASQIQLVSLFPTAYQFVLRVDLMGSSIVAINGRMYIPQCYPLDLRIECHIVHDRFLCFLLLYLD